ncbi:MAG: cell division protein FtsA [Bacteroidia bacterium]|nr:cell division protein FtsA [Bacteroidia bacterium]MDW8158455.1 cell division protein FtsA [Bacteroidia bacterium]
MASKDKIVVGLDIGTTKVAAIVGKLNDYGKVNILGIGKAPCEGVRKGVVIDIEKTVLAIQEAVKEAEIKANIDIKAVHVGIAGEHIRSMTQRGIVVLNNTNGEITLQELNRLKEDTYKAPVSPGTDIIHVIPQDYSVDNEHGVKYPVGMHGVRLEGRFHVVTAQSTSARNIYTCVRRAGLEAKQLILQPLASSYAVLTEEEKEAGVCLVDIGGGTTDIAVFQDKIIRHTAVIPLGSNNVTEDIRKGCSIMSKYAEAIKVKYGAAIVKENMADEIISISHLPDRPPKEISKHTLTRIIQCRMEEIMEMVLYQLYEQGLLKKLTAGIVLTGGGASLQGIEELVEYVTGLDARVGDPTQQLAQGLVDEVRNPIYATGVGLTIYGLLHDEQEYAPFRGGSEKGSASRTALSFTEKVRNWFEKTLNSANNIIN